MRFVCADGEGQCRALLDEQLLEELGAAGHELAWFDGRPPDADAWVERLHDCDGVLLLWPMPAGVLVRVQSMRVISFAGTGIEAYVDVEEARRLGIVLCNVPGYGANAVAEHAFALALPVARKRGGRRPDRPLGPLEARRALVALLERGAILGAGLDVFEAEPLPLGHPLLGLDNVVLTPHIGFNTPQASAELMRIALENIVAFAAGRPRTWSRGRRRPESRR